LTREINNHHILVNPVHDSRTGRKKVNLIVDKTTFEFHKEGFNLLERGSREGFTAREFHRRCDGRANTPTLILDTDGNEFGSKSWFMHLP
jgi:hypothetical protein